MRSFLVLARSTRETLVPGSIDAQRALAVPVPYMDVFTALMYTQLQIWYEKLTEQERTALKNIMKKSPAYKDSPLSRMKRG